MRVKLLASSILLLCKYSPRFHSLLHAEVLGRVCTVLIMIFDMQTKELNNGRLAMIAVAAFVVQVSFTASQCCVIAFKCEGQALCICWSVL